MSKNINEGFVEIANAKTMDEAISKAADAVKCLVTDGPELAMTRFNTKKDEAK